MADKDAGQIVAGRNAVRELLHSDRKPEVVYLLHGQRQGSILAIVAEARKLSVKVEEVSREKMEHLCPGVVHQGICARARAVEYATVEEMIALAASRGEKPLIVIADRIADPGNFGALLRCCEGAGVHGVVFPKHDASPVTPTVMKASAGAANHLLLCRATNLSAVCEKLKDLGLWICAMEADGEDYSDFDYDLPLAIILGSEEKGVSRLLRERSDFCISLPMCGKVNSLNVSCAGAVVLYEALSARRRKQKN